MTSERLLVTFNAGSSTVKIGLFIIDGTRARRIGKGKIDFHASPLRFELNEGPDLFDILLSSSPGEKLDAVIGEAFSRLAWHFDLDAIDAIGHRVVHGGDRFTGPIAVDDAALAEMHKLVPWAPLHQPQALRLIEAIRRMRPGLRQTVSFDTAFHRSNEDLVRRFALPRALHDQGLKRYGFHGLSYKFIAAEMKLCLPQLAAGRVIVAHMGAGVSLCGLHNGVSRDVSMGFSTLDGAPMATRCGAIDPGVLLHLMQFQGKTVKDVSELLYYHSGLLGVSGISADTRDLLASSAPEAREALDMFAFRIAGEVARIASTLGGLDGLVFTGGIGEHQPAIRKMICARLAWLGIRLNEEANTAGSLTIHDRTSTVAAIVIATDEEQVIADEALQIAEMRKED